MAEYINMQQTEYDEVQTRLTTIHEEILEAETLIREKILELTQIEGGFYIESISGNIDQLLEKMKEIPLAQLEASFQNTEQSLSEFVDAIVQIDVVDN